MENIADKQPSLLASAHPTVDLCGHGMSKLPILIKNNKSLIEKVAACVTQFFFPSAHPLLQTCVIIVLLIAVIIIQKFMGESIKQY